MAASGFKVRQPVLQRLFHHLHRRHNHHFGDKVRYLNTAFPDSATLQYVGIDHVETQVALGQQPQQRLVDHEVLMGGNRAGGLHHQDLGIDVRALEQPPDALNMSR